MRYKIKIEEELMYEFMAVWGLGFMIASGVQGNHSSFWETLLGTFVGVVIVTMVQSARRK